MGERRRRNTDPRHVLRLSKGSGAKRRSPRAKKAVAKANKKPLPTGTPATCAYLGAILANDGLVPVYEYRFHPERKWRFDIAFPYSKVAIEVHGSVFTGGRHTTGAGFSKDREKMNEAQLMGWIVLEYPTHLIRKYPLKPPEDVRRAMASR